MRWGGFFSLVEAVDSRGRERRAPAMGGGGGDDVVCAAAWPASPPKASPQRASAPTTCRVRPIRAERRFQLFVWRRRARAWCDFPLRPVRVLRRTDKVVPLFVLRKEFWNVLRKPALTSSPLEPLAAERRARKRAGRPCARGWVPAHPLPEQEKRSRARASACQAFVNTSSRWTWSELSTCERALPVEIV